MAYYMKYLVYYVITHVITPVIAIAPLYTHEIPSRPAAVHGAALATELWRRLRRGPCTALLYALLGNSAQQRDAHGPLRCPVDRPVGAQGTSPGGARAHGPHDYPFDLPC